MRQWVVRTASLVSIATAIACGTLLEVGDAPATSDGGASGDGGPGAACSVTVTPAALDFGEVFAGSVGAATLAIENGGGAESNVTVTATPATFSVSETSFPLGPGAKKTIDVRLTAPVIGPPLTGDVVVEASGCAPIKVPLAGRIASGSFAVSPGSFALSGPCGTTPGPLGLQIRTSDAGANWSATVSPSSLPIVVTPDAGTVPAGSVFDASVAATGLLPNSPGDAGSGFVVLDIIGDAQRQLPVWLTSYGAVLTATPTFLSLSSGKASGSFSLWNTGTASVTLQVKLTGMFESNPIEDSSFSLNAGSAQMITVTARGTSSTGQLYFVATGPVCGSLPTVSLSYP